MGEVTADGDVIVGRRRPKNNPLIHRSEVGRPSFHNDLPPLPPDYTFGAPMKKDAEGAGDVMLTWQTHCPPPSKQQYDFGRDFVTLNRHSVKGHCHSAKQVGEYRKEHDARIKPKINDKKTLTVPAHIMNNPSYAYGSHSGESESVADLIQNRWELEWVAEQRKRQAKMEMKAQSEKKRKAELQRLIAKMETKGQKVAATPPPADFFTMKRFRDVPSRFMTPSPTAFS